jgi:hypothetical protein
MWISWKSAEWRPYFAYGREWNYTHWWTVEPCDILTLKNASVKYVYSVTECAICSLVTLVQGWRTFGTRAQNDTLKDSLGTRHSLLSLLLFLLPDQRLYIVNNICIYTYLLHTHCIWITVATKWHCSETFAHAHSRERCELLTGYLSSGRRAGGAWANTWHWTERFTVFFWNRKQ